LIHDICGICNGSGEGYWDGSTCSSCKGSGNEVNYCSCERGNELLSEEIF